MCEKSRARAGLRLTQDHRVVAALQRVQLDRLSVETNQGARDRLDVPLTPADTQYVY